MAYFNGLRKDILYCGVSDVYLWYEVKSIDVVYVIVEWYVELEIYVKCAGILRE